MENEKAAVRHLLLFPVLNLVLNLILTPGQTRLLLASMITKHCDCGALLPAASLHLGCVSPAFPQ